VIDLAGRGVVFGTIFARIYLIYINCQIGDLETAHRLLKETKKAAIKEGSRAFDALFIQLGEAEISISKSSGEDSRKAYFAVIRDFEKAGIRWWAAKARIFMARGLIRHGTHPDIAHARELLGEALLEFKDMGATGYVEMIETEIRELLLHG
jgi:hypothetical protein